jgi:hypothetical protein
MKLSDRTSEAARPDGRRSPQQTVLQRPEWRGEPVRLGEIFILNKDNRTARCHLQTHQLGWELRLEVDGELVRSQVCRDQEEVLSTGEGWKLAMKKRGWA